MKYQYQLWGENIKLKQQLKNLIQKNSSLRRVYNRLFRLKLLKRRIDAKPIRIRQMNDSLEDIKKAPDGPKIYFCGVPTHNNLGDQAQRYCIRKWCKENYSNHYILEVPSWALYERVFRNKVKEVITDQDIIIIQSGYTTTDRHFDHEMHRLVVKEFQNNRILIMPQTVNFFEDNQARLTGNIYDKHRKLVFLARDAISYNNARKIFKTTKVFCFPDIVTTLIGTLKVESNERNGVLLCIRNDCEKKYTDAEIKALCKRFHDAGMLCNITDTNSELPVEELIEKFEDELTRIIAYFSKHQVVITDRYHGTIFSLISNTPVIVLSTNDHKVKTGTQWFDGVYDNAFYNANSISDAYDIAIKVLSETTIVENGPYFKREYYDKLKDIFENETNEKHGDMND